MESHGVSFQKVCMNPAVERLTPPDIIGAQSRATLKSLENIMEILYRGVRLLFGAFFI